MSRPKELLKIAAFLALCGGLWAAQEWWVRVQQDILVVDKGGANINDQTARFVIVTAEAGDHFQYSTRAAQTPLQLDAQVVVGCRYRIAYIDESRYLVERGDGRFITRAEKLDCPGAPEKPKRRWTAEEILNRR